MNKEEIIQTLRNKYFFYLGKNRLEVCFVLKEILAEMGYPV